MRNKCLRKLQKQVQLVQEAKQQAYRMLKRELYCIHLQKKKISQFVILIELNYRVSEYLEFSHIDNVKHVL